MKTLLLRLSSRFSIPAAAMAAVLLLALAGCTTPDPVVSAAPAVDRPARAVRDADELFQRGRATEAILACIEIARKDPLAPGLADLQSRILNRLNEQRRASITARAAASHESMAQDARRQGLVPDTYGVSRHLIGDISSHNSPRTKMQQALTNEISMHLEDTDLAGIITELGDSGINLVSDSDISSKTLTIHTENTPLRELLEFIGRNLDVSFNVGETLIWVTSRLPTDGPIPLETRVYRLRIGLPGNEVPGGAALGETAQTGSGEIAIVDAIKKFVPQPAGSEISFDTRAHALLIKNTRQYLTETETIINALDVRPLQVLIEARFINTKANDTRALGIDWLLAGPMSSTANNSQTIPGGPEIVKASDGKTLTKTISADDLSLTGRSIGAGMLQNGAGSLLYSGVLDDIRLKAVLQAMESSGQTRTLTVPRITTVNNRTATIHIGEEFQYYDNLTAPVNQNLNNSYNNPLLLTAVTAWQAQITGYGAKDKWDTATSNIVTQLQTMIANANNQILTQGAQSNNPLFTGTPKTISLGYNLSVTPSVGADLATINLALIPDITELQNKSEWEAANTPGKATFQTLGMLPIVMQKKIETEMVVRSGETVVMGGLAQASGGKDRTGIPWLSHIPLLGWLFRTDSTNEGADNLLVFVTATLISDMGENLIPLTPHAGPGTAVPPAALSEAIGIEDGPLE